MDEDGLTGIAKDNDHEDVQADFYNDLKQYVVPNYYEINDMRKNLPSEMPQYSSTRKFMKNVKGHIDNAFKDENYQRAVQFADDEYRNELQQFRGDLEAKWQSRFVEELAKEGETEKKLRAELIKNYEAGIREIKSHMEKAEQSRESEYELACSDMSSSSASQKAQYTLNLLAKIGDYKDALQKKVAVKAVVDKQQEINNCNGGNTYILQKTLCDNREDWAAYKEAHEQMLSKDSPTILNYVLLAPYAFLIFGCTIAGGIPSTLCIIAGYLLCWYLWKKDSVDQIVGGYIALMVLHVLQAFPFDWKVALVLAVIYLVSGLSKKGFAKLLITNRCKKVTLKKCEDRIRSDEENYRTELNEIWQKAFSIDYDGIMLKSALDKESVQLAFGVLRQLQS